jgi:hypothetical protein
VAVCVAPLPDRGHDDWQLFSPALVPYVRRQPPLAKASLEMELAWELRQLFLREAEGVL